MDYLFGILCDNKCIQLISVNPRDAGTALKMMQERRGTPEVFTTLWVYALQVTKGSMSQRFFMLLQRVFVREHPLTFVTWKSFR